MVCRLDDTEKQPQKTGYLLITLVALFDKSTSF